MKHIADMARDSGHGFIHCGLLTYQYLAGGWTQQTVCHFGHCGFSSAVFSDNGNLFALSDFQVDAMQRLKAVGIGKFNIF